jgi:hypothetical protein
VLDRRTKVGFNAPVESFLDADDPQVQAALLEDSPVFDIIRRDKIEQLLAKRDLPNSESKFLSISSIPNCSWRKTPAEREIQPFLAFRHAGQSRMRYCRTCVLPDTRPNLRVDEEGVCNACRAHASKPSIDWVAREQMFRSLVAGVRKQSGYDCLIPVSGGKDSTWQTVKCLEYGLTPLAVTWKTPARTRSDSAIWTTSCVWVSITSTTRSIPG